MNEGMLWTPGNGMTTRVERQAAKAVEEYSSDLRLGQREDTKEWVVYLANGPGSNGQPFPVFSLGYTLPNPEVVKERLWKADVRRHGDKIKKQIQEYATRKPEVSDEQNEMLAEVLVEGFRNRGFNPFPKSYRNLHPKNRPFRNKES